MIYLWLPSLRLDVNYLLEYAADPFQSMQRWFCCMEMKMWGLEEKTGVISIYLTPCSTEACSWKRQTESAPRSSSADTALCLQCARTLSSYCDMKCIDTNEKQKVQLLQNIILNHCIYIIHIIHGCYVTYVSKFRHNNSSNVFLCYSCVFNCESFLHLYYIIIMD